MNLVHVGLHKTASTALQNSWGNTDGINLNWRTLDKLIHAIRHMVGSNTATLDLNLEALELSKSADANLNIYSNEGLSTYRYGAMCSRQNVFDFRQLAAYYMEKIAPDSHVLIVTREPISWISSIYKQYVQEGGHRTLQNFLITESEFIAETLSLQTLIDIWSAYFPREKVIVLPFEMLKNEPQRFLAELASRTGNALFSQAAPLPVANVSITDEELAFLRKVNRWVKLMSDNTTEETSLLIEQQKSQLITRLRLELQYKQKISVLANKLDLDHNDDARLPDAITQSIVEQNLLYLKEEFGDYYGYLPQYLSNFN